MKKILFIHNSFRDYSKRIINHFIKDNSQVFIITLECKNKSKNPLTFFYKEKYLKNINLVKQRNYISELEKYDFDYVFVLTGLYLNSEFLNLLKLKYSKAKFLLYLWDSVIKIDSILERIPYFDIIFSFDFVDCNKYGFTYLPLFYVDDFTEFPLNKRNDLFYCGNSRSYRFELLKTIDSFSRDNNLNTKAILLTSYWRYLFNSVFSSDFRKYKKYFTYNEVSLNDFAKSMCESKVCVDMQDNFQTGLTMRCIESLPAQTKIITTNEHIKEYDFYCPENVMIIDRENPVFDVDFIKSPYKPIPKEIVEKYSLENWIKTIFSE